MADSDVKQLVRDRYGQEARRVLSGAAVSGASDAVSGDLYSETDAAAVPAEALKASVGCGNYRAADFAVQTRRLTGGHGADVILDGVGGQILADSLGCLAYRGRCVSFGDAGRQPGTPVDVSGLRHGNQSVTGYFLGAELISGDRARRMIGGLLDDVAAGQLRVVIDRTFPLAEAAAAHAYVESRQAFGRVLLKP